MGACGDAEEPTTRSALRVLEPTDVARPFMQWAMQGSNYDKYMEAIQLQEGTFFTKASQRPTFVMWTTNPIALKESFFTRAQGLFEHVALYYFLFNLLGSYIIA